MHSAMAHVLACCLVNGCVLGGSSCNRLRACWFSLFGVHVCGPDMSPRIAAEDCLHEKTMVYLFHREDPHAQQPFKGCSQEDVLHLAPLIGALRRAGTMPRWPRTPCTVGPLQSPVAPCSRSSHWPPTTSGTGRDTGAGVAISLFSPLPRAMDTLRVDAIRIEEDNRARRESDNCQISHIGRSTPSPCTLSSGVLGRSLCTRSVRS